MSRFQTCQLVLQVGIEVQKGMRSGWMDANEARDAAEEWRCASKELHKIEHPIANVRSQSW